MTSIAPTVYIVEDEEMVAEALDSYLRSAGLRALLFSSPAKFLAQPLADHPSCAILDINLPGKDGLTLQRELTTAGIEIPVIIITGQGDVRKAVQAMKAGALEFLTKPLDPRVLLAAVRRALERDSANRLEREALDSLRKRLLSLSAREHDVMNKVVGGMLNKQIAAEMGISEVTVKIHRGRVMRKMKATSLADLASMADRLARSKLLGQPGSTFSSREV